VEFCSAVRRQIQWRTVVNAESDIGGAYRSGSRELGDGNVVGVPVASFRTEGNNHVGLDSPDMSDNGTNRNVGLNPIHGTVRVARTDLTDTEHRRGSSQFSFTNAPGLNRIAALSVSRSGRVLRA
jgi:hypothetical protein